MRRPLAAVPALLLLTAAVMSGAGALASSPSSGTLTVPRAGTASVRWTGTVGPGADLGCGTSTTVTDDHHTLTLAVPAGLYAKAQTAVTIAMTAAADADLQVLDKSGAVVADSSGGGGNEKVVLKNPAAGSYDVQICNGGGPSVAYKASATAATTSSSSGCSAGRHGHRERSPRHARGLRVRLRKRPPRPGWP